MVKITITLAQTAAKQGQLQTNVAAMQQHAAEAARRGSHILVLPELWDSGYAIKQAREFASPLNAGIFSQISTAAKQHKLCITGSSFEKRGDGVANSAAFFIPNGSSRGVYRKIHLFSPTNEGKYMLPGQSPLTMDLPWGKTSLAICYDLRFPELFRRYGIDGAALVIVPSAWPAARLEHWRALLKARAIENQYFIAACNCVGEVPGEDGAPLRFGGHSMIIDPWGETVLEAGSGEGLFSAEIDLDAVAAVRQQIPVFADRQPKTYGLDDIMSQLDF